MKTKSTFLTLFFSITLLTSCETIDILKPEKKSIEPSPETYRSINLGPVIGFEGSFGVHTWLGIPYTKAPKGDLRWRAPRKNEPWEKVYAALHHSSPCVQFQSAFTGSGLSKPGDIIGQEDCLYLNVYAPPVPSQLVPEGKESLPVMVWIHGGGNTTGMTSDYNPEKLVSSQRVIVVSVSYRLGLFGWLSHPDIRKQSDELDQSSNFGLLDQIAALQWVRDNIGFFGGNPNNITIFGESAGGQNVMALYVSPLSKGLFHKAISQSGGIGITTIEDAESIDRSNPKKRTNYKYQHKTTEEWIGSLKSLGVMKSDFGEDNLQELRSLSPHELLSIWDKEQAWDEEKQMARIIGDDIVIPSIGILEALRDKNLHANVPIILGINRDENKLFNLFDEELVTNILNLTFIVKDSFYYDLKSDYQSLAWRTNAVDTPADAIANSGYENVYTYRFDWDEQPKILGMDFSFMLGAAHGLEIPFVMGHFDMGRETAFLYNKKNEQGRFALSHIIMQYWAEFARNGYPGKGSKGEWEEWKQWPAGGTRSSRIMILDTPISGGPRMSESYVPQDKLVWLFDADSRSSKVKDKCSFLNDVYSWVDNWKETNQACLGGYSVQ